MVQLLLFDTTHHALLAEQIAVESGLPVQVAPAPADSTAKCDLALEFLSADAERLLTLLDGRNVRYYRYGLTESGGNPPPR